MVIGAGPPGEITGAALCSWRIESKSFGPLILLAFSSDIVGKSLICCHCCYWTLAGFIVSAVAYVLATACAFTYYRACPFLRALISALSPD